MGKNYSKEDLTRIGRNVASLWGAECISISFDLSINEYVFDCIEHGENFFTSLSKEELSDYDY